MNTLIELAEEALQAEADVHLPINWDGEYNAERAATRAALMAALQSRRCDTCKRWDPEEDKPGWGICHAACGKHGKPYDHDHTDTPLYATANNAGSWEEQPDEWCIYSHLHTKADFGCVIWEAGDDAE